MKRIATALVLIPITLFILFFAAVHWLVALVLALVLISLSEFNKLTAQKSPSGAFDLFSILAAMALPIIYYLTGGFMLLPVLLPTIFLLFFTGMLAGTEPRELYGYVLSRTFGLLYISLPLTFLVAIRLMDGGVYWILFLLVLIWVNDSAAYFTGRAIGRRKLCPSISPGKTVEGAIGGLVGGLVAGFVVVRLCPIELAPLALVLLSLSIGVAGIVGDLAESIIKRSVGAKDSGTIIPGHGGLLDRIDSLLFALPVLYYFVRLTA